MHANRPIITDEARVCRVSCVVCVCVSAHCGRLGSSTTKVLANSMMTAIQSAETDDSPFAEAVLLEAVCIANDICQHDALVAPVRTRRGDLGRCKLGGLTVSIVGACVRACVRACVHWLVVGRAVTTATGQLESVRAPRVCQEHEAGMVCGSRRLFALYDSARAGNR